MTAIALVAVELSGPPADPRFLAAHPAVRHVAAGQDGGLTLWVDPRVEHDARWADAPPDRAPDVELHGPGAPNPAFVEHPDAAYVEVFFDGLGDPDHAPRGWWHARVWLKNA